MLGGDELTETWNDFSYFEDDADDDEVCDGPAVILLAIGSDPAHSNARTCMPGPGLGCGPSWGFMHHPESLIRPSRT